MFKVKRCQYDYGEVWRTTVAEFDTEEQAEAFAIRNGIVSLFQMYGTRLKRIHLTLDIPAGSCIMDRY